MNTGMKFHIVSSLAALVVLFASSAQAQFMRSSDQLGFYAGASVASAKIKDVCSTSAAAGLAVTSCDEKDKSWKLSAGYQFHPNIAVELGYVDLGKYNVTGTAGGATGVLGVKIKAFEFLALGIVPFTTQLSGYVKAGGYRWDADISAAGPGGAGSIGADGTDFTYGIGVKYDFTRNLAARLEWQHYLDTDVRTIGGGIVWHFR